MFMQYSTRFNLRPGDRMISPIFATGLSKHHSIYLGADHAGTEWIIENYKFRGVRLVKASEYFLHPKSFNIKPFLGTGLQRQQAVQRALREIGKPYDLINYNCEHF